MIFNNIFVHNLSNHNLNQQDISSFYKHQHDCYEIFIFIEGDIEYIVEERVYTLIPYQILILKPHQYHFAIIKDKAVYRRIIINFEIEDIQRLKKLLTPEFIDLNTYPNLLNLLNGILASQSLYSKQDFSELITNTIKTLLIVHDSSQKSSNYINYKTLNPYIRRAFQYMDSNINSKITLDKLADHLNINPYYFSRLFKDATKESPMSYIRNKQLVYAKSLIESGEYPTKVYYKCGFSDYSSFYRAYKSFFGNVPSQDKS